MVDSGWTDAHSIWYILTEQRSQKSVPKERGVANRVDPLGVHYHGYHLCMNVRERKRGGESKIERWREGGREEGGGRERERGKGEREISITFLRYYYIPTSSWS